MIKIVFVACWAALVAISSGLAMTRVREQQARRSPETAAPKLETRKTKEINVPKIRDGAVKGYVVAQLSYVVNAAAMDKAPLSPDSFVVDETFKYLYDDETIDFDRLDKFDLRKMTSTLIERINRRLKVDAVADIGIQEFTFMSTVESKAR
jgi:hypothetical protein